jgi:hypothetical protein
MIKVKKIKDMGRTKNHWLDSLHHFSFGEYHDNTNVSYGPLRVLNDDIITPQGGFAEHSHRDMEIITYMVDGKLTHKDNITEEERTIERGDIQYMSAGQGIVHSEYNKGQTPVRLLQIWIIPNEYGLNPIYAEQKFHWEDRVNKWMLMVSPEDGMAPVKLFQDVEIYALYLEKGNKISFPMKNHNKSFYLTVIEGDGRINGEYIRTHQDAYGTQSFELEPVHENLHVLLFIL